MMDKLIEAFLYLSLALSIALLISTIFGLP